MPCIHLHVFSHIQISEQMWKVFKSTKWDGSQGISWQTKKAFDNLQSPIMKIVEPQETEGSLRLDSVATENPTSPLNLKLKDWTHKYKVRAPLTWFVLALNVLATHTAGRKCVCLMQRIVSSPKFGAVRDQPEKPTTFLYIYNEQMKHASHYVLFQSQ